MGANDGTRICRMGTDKHGCYLRIREFVAATTSLHWFKHTFAFMNLHDDLQQRWWNLEAQLVERFGKKPDLDAVLYLIGLQEMQLFDQNISKETKQDLMHVAVCTILSPSGYYVLEGKDEDGWPHFKQLKALPDMGLREQEDFLKDHLLLYFEQEKFAE